MDKASTRQRPTQEMRREAMKERLYEATLQVILEEGWHQASTQKIAARAGVSRGAQTHHFQSKTDLLLAAIRNNVRRYQAAIDEQAEALLAGEGALRTYLDLLWDGSQEAGFLPSWVEALVAARTDSELCRQVVETDRVAIDKMRDFGRRASQQPEKADLGADLVEMTAYLLRGMEIQRGAHGEQEHMHHLFERWSRIADVVMGLDAAELDTSAL